MGHKDLCLTICRELANLQEIIMMRSQCCLFFITMRRLKMFASSGAVYQRPIRLYQSPSTVDLYRPLHWKTDILAFSAGQGYTWDKCSVSYFLGSCMRFGNHDYIPIYFMSSCQAPRAYQLIHLSDNSSICMYIRRRYHMWLKIFAWTGWAVIPDSLQTYPYITRHRTAEPGYPCWISPRHSWNLC